MTDDEQIQGLLTQAAELPDDLQPPVGALLVRARRRRSLRAAFSLLGAAVVVAAAVALPAVLRTQGSSPVTHVRTPVGPATPPPPGPAAAQIARFRWSQLPASPLGPRSEPLLAWAGKELLELGGFRKGASQHDGTAFSPATGRWHSIPSPAASNVGFWNAVDVWTGRQLFVTNDQEESCGAVRGQSGTPASCWPHAGLYDPATNSWTSTRLPTQLYGLDLMAAVWTGREVVLAGTSAHHGRLGVAAYNPATNHWQVITPTLPAGHPARYVTMIALPGRLLLWSLWDRVTTRKDGYSDRAGVDVLALGRDGTWRVTTGHWPQNDFVTAPTYTGSKILLSPEAVWCGTRCVAAGVPGGSGPGYFADPAMLTRTPIPAGPLAQTGPTYIWTGRAIIAIDRHTDIGNPGHLILREDDMALYDPATRRWTKLPAPPGYPKLAAPPTWTGTELLELSDTGRLLSFHR